MQRKFLHKNSMHADVSQEINIIIFCFTEHQFCLSINTIFSAILSWEAKLYSACAHARMHTHTHTLVLLLKHTKYALGLLEILPWDVPVTPCIYHNPIIQPTDGLFDTGRISTCLVYKILPGQQHLLLRDMHRPVAPRPSRSMSPLMDQALSPTLWIIGEGGEDHFQNQHLNQPLLGAESSISTTETHSLLHAQHSVKFHSYTAISKTSFS